MKNMTTVDELLERAKFRNAFEVLPQGDTYKNLSTIVIIPVRGVSEEKGKLNCKKCKTPNEYTTSIGSGMHPLFVQSYYRHLVRPMNVPWIEIVPNGYEVGDAYSKTIEQILSNPQLNTFKYILTVEDDNIIPFIPNTQGPFMMLIEDMEKGYDVAGGLYWTKGTPSMPLLYGDPKEKKETSAGMFKVRMDWQKKKPGPIECNGMGMGFTLFKMEIFKDARIEKPWFKTVSEHGDQTPKQYTQDLQFFEKIRKLGYRVCVDTRIKLGHLDVKTGTIY